MSISENASVGGTTRGRQGSVVASKLGWNQTQRHHPMCVLRTQSFGEDRRVCCPVCNVRPLTKVDLRVGRVTGFPARVESMVDCTLPP